MFFFAYSAKAQFTDPGLPFIQNYTTEEYPGHAQNWAIVQSDDGKMYFGNTEGIMEFDGHNWRLIELPSEAGVLSLAKSIDGHIYAGAFGDIGYLEPDSNNLLNFISLKDKIPEKHRQFEAVWETLVTSTNKILFRTTQAIYIYDALSGRIDIATPNTQFLRFFNKNENIYVRERDQGLKKLINKKPTLVPDGEMFADESVYGIEEYDEDALLIFTRTRILLFFPFGKIKNERKIHFEQFKTEIDPYIAEHRVYKTLRLKNGKYAIGTSTGGLIIIDKNGKLYNKISEREGLQNNTVRNVFQDSYNNLWVATNNGLSYIILNSAINIFNKSNGLSGIVFNTAIKDDLIYAATSTGLYVKDGYKDFQKVENTTGEVFMLQKIDDELYAANSYSMYQIKGFSATEVLNNYTWSLHYIKEINGTKYYIAGSVDGLYIYSKDGIKWNIHKKIEGFDIYSRYLEIDNNGDIWVAHTNKGVYKITLNESFEAEQVRHYTDKDGLPSLLNNRVFSFFKENKKHIVYGTDKGLYRHNFKNDNFEIDPFFAKQLGNEKEISRFEQNIDGNISFRQGERLGILIKEPSNNFSLTMTPFLKLEGIEIEHINAIGKNFVIFGAEEGMYVYNAKSDFSPIQLFRTYIPKISCQDTIIRNPSHKENSDILEIPYGKKRFLFAFSAGYYEEHNKTQFKYILEGYDDDWSDWTNETKKEYTNLKEGNYTFKVVSKNIHETEGEIAQFEFIITPPWHRTTIAYIIYIVLTIALIWLIIVANTARLKRAKEKLENEVQQRTSDLQKANVMLEEHHAELQQQQEEIMSQKEILEKQNEAIIKKNEELEKRRIEIKAKNEELEKLSIVASKTDNSVIITDKNGDFEWANVGFSKLYEQSLRDFKRKFGNNIFTTSSNPERKNIKERVLAHKKSAVYESTVYKSNGEEIWLQTTLTPILDKNGEITKLIAIDTNINKQKTAEREIKKQNRKLERQNLTITESINYAKTMQQHMLPSQARMNEVFSSFIINKPKNIVSGDFYWFSCNAEKDEYLVALVDCTGHGVPGGFMTIMGIDLLNSIVNIQGIKEPSEIISKLDKGIITSLKQDSSDNLDGMDMILCKIKKENSKYNISFVGANRPLIYYSWNEQEIKHIKGWNKTLGGVYLFSEDFNYESKEIQLEKEDLIYLISDGFTDQLNEVQVKYGTKKLHAILNKIAPLSLEEQKSILEQELEIHQQSASQYDDITIWGIRLK